MQYCITLAAVLLVSVCRPSLCEPCSWDGVRRIVAVGDVHGDLDQFVKILRTAGVIDMQNSWTGGKTHLVQTGDVLDRGPDSRKVLDLLWRLEKEAELSGGCIHTLVGNHEAMVFQGDFRYVHKGEYASYGGSESMAAALGPEGEYGNRILSNNALIRIDDFLFLHGGISPRYRTGTIGDINSAVRMALPLDKTVPNGVLTSEGPLWFRGYAEESENELWKDVQDLFIEFGTRHVVVGHSVTDKGILLRCGGRIILIDTGLSRHYGGIPQCLVIEDGKIRSVGL